MNEASCALTSDEKIKKAIFQIGALKALGLDGFSKIFYRAHLNIIGPMVTQAIKSFFTFDVLSKRFLKTA